MHDVTVAVPGLRWHPSGQAVLSEPLLGKARALDAAFLRVAARWSAEEHRFPTFISAAELHKLDYLRSFPQLATFPVTLRHDDDNLAAFVGRDPVRHGAVQLTDVDPVREVLTPAACYHLYIHLQGTELDRPAYLTTRNTCFRHEEYYRPLQRQWGFTMREVVCIGSPSEVRHFLSGTRRYVDQVLSELDVPVTWEQATDPFFRPSLSGQYLMQRLDPVKHEMVYGSSLAIGSANFHQDHFGGTFSITRDGSPAYSGCVAFGVERWLFALIDRHGPDSRAWPELPVAEPGDV